MNYSSIITKNIRLVGILSIATCILLTPLIAIYFTNEIDWKPSDFLMMGILLYSAGLCCEVVLRRFLERTYRLLISLGILLVFFLVWAELAVGVLGTPFAGN